LPGLPCLKGHSYEDLCFPAQQAAEKSLKAIYQHFGKRFRYTHDLDELITGLRNEGIIIPIEVTDAALLTSYAWEARYPGLTEPVTEEEFLEALR
jgi:HEPN domain-containing protein